VILSKLFCSWKKTVSNDTQVAFKMQHIIHSIVGIQVSMRVDDGGYNAQQIKNAFKRQSGSSTLIRIINGLIQPDSGGTAKCPRLAA
jgi:energy-coupling factor transporter ATP-binding protein EcfA2